MNQNLSANIKSLMTEIKTSLSLPSGSIDITEKKIDILKQLRDLDTFLTDNSQWLVSSSIGDLKIKFNELLIEEQKQGNSLLDYYQNFEDIAQSIENKMNTSLESSREIFEEFLSHETAEQIKFLKDPENSNLMEFFVPFLNELSSHPEIFLLVLKEVFNSDIEYREPFISMIKTNFYMQGIAAQKSNDSKIIFDLLSVQQEEIEKIILSRVKNKTLKIPSPGLFEYWGFLSKDSKLQMVQEELTSLDQFEPIARGLALQAKEENSLLWMEIVKLPIFPEIESFLKENPSLYESCLEKWPNLFLKS